MGTNFKIDTWYKALLLVGLSAVFASLTTTAEFVRADALFTFGFSMAAIGMIVWVGQKTMVIRERDGIWTGPVFASNWLNGLLIAMMLLLGVWSLWIMLSPLIMNYIR